MNMVGNVRITARPIPKPPFRGIIIADTSALIDMECRVSPHLKSNDGGIERYLDILPFLAEHGYRILIPEIVAYETTTTLSGGKDINHYFPRPAKPGWFAHTDLVEFFDKVHKGQWPNITITPTTDPPEVAGFLQVLHRIVDANPEPSFGAARALAAAQAGFKTDFGDKTVGFILQKLVPPMKRVSVPVFFLSTDRNAMRDFANDYPDACMLTFNGMMDGLLKAKLHAPLGLTQQCSTQNVINDIATQSHLASDGAKGAHTAIIDLSGKRYIEWFNRPGFDTCVKDKPFSGSASKLGTELNGSALPQRNPCPDTAKDDEAIRPGSAQDRFTQKYTREGGKWVARQDGNDDNQRRKGNGRGQGH